MYLWSLCLAGLSTLLRALEVGLALLQLLGNLLVLPVCLLSLVPGIDNFCTYIFYLYATMPFRLVYRTQLI